MSLNVKVNRVHEFVKISLRVHRKKRLKSTTLRCAAAQYHQETICIVKSHSRALATFQNIGKAGKQEAI